jgi:hypothetical protein
MILEKVAKPIGIIKAEGGVNTKLFYNSPVELTSKIYANDARFAFRLITKTDKNIKSIVKGKPLQKRGKIAVYSEKSKRRYRFLLRNTQKIWSHELEVGYPADFPMDGKKVKRDIRLLKESLQREYQGIAWTWRLGFQRRNAPHVHFLTDRPVDYKWLARRWYEIVGSGDPKHLKAGTHVDKIKNVGKIINYMVTYMANDKETVVPEGFEDVGRFWGVKRGIVECEEFKKIAPYGVASRKLRLFRRWAKAEYRSMGYKWKWQGLGFTALNGRRFFDALMKLVE